MHLPINTISNQTEEVLMEMKYMLIDIEDPTLRKDLMATFEKLVLNMDADQHDVANFFQRVTAFSTN